MPRKKAALDRGEQKRRGEALVERHLQQGRTQQELFAAITLENLQHMETAAVAKGKCLRCWQSARNGVCICPDLRPVLLRTPVHIVVWYHPRDWLCGGDDAKLLRACAGAGNTTQLLFGRPADDEQLTEILRRGGGRSVLLFPDKTAITADEFVQRARGGGSGGGPAAPGQGEGEDEQPITVVVLNGTWNNVKPILKHFNKHIDPAGRIPHVALKPETLSVYQRATKKNAKGVAPEHICTVEAVALLLKECGEDEANCNTLVKYVELNNAALKGKRVLAAWRASDGGGGGGGHGGGAGVGLAAAAATGAAQPLEQLPLGLV
eukprot:SAG22_NODE_736_length_7533_cov_9.168281_5_plen_321_part_00